MAEFTTVPNASSPGFNPAAGLLTLGVGQSSKIALVGGDGLSTAVDDSSVASIVEEAQVASDQRTFTVTGLAPGRTLVLAKDDAGAAQASLQITIQAASGGGRWREVFRDFRITDEDRAKLTPEDIAVLERGVQDLIDNPPPVVEFSNPERFSDNVLVKQGEKHPPDWGKKK